MNNYYNGGDPKPAYPNQGAQLPYYNHGDPNSTFHSQGAPIPFYDNRSHPPRMSPTDLTQPPYPQQFTPYAHGHAAWPYPSAPPHTIQHQHNPYYSSSMPPPHASYGMYSNSDPRASVRFSTGENSAVSEFSASTNGNNSGARGSYSASTTATNSDSAGRPRPSPQQLTYTPAARQNRLSTTKNNYSQNTPNDAALPSDHLNSVIQGRLQRDPPEAEAAARQTVFKDPPARNAHDPPRNAHDDHSFSSISFSTAKNTNRFQMEDSSQLSHQEEEECHQEKDEFFVPVLPPDNSQRTGQQAETAQGQQAETTEKVMLPFDLLKKEKNKIDTNLALSHWEFAWLFLGTYLKDVPQPTSPMTALQSQQVKDYVDALKGFYDSIARAGTASYIPEYVKAVGERRGHRFESTTDLVSMQNELLRAFPVIIQGQINKANLKTLLSAFKVPYKCHKGIVEKIVADVLREYPNVEGIKVDGHGKNFVDDIFYGKAETASQRLRAGMKKWSGAIWYDIKSGIESSFGSNQVKIEDMEVWIADQQTILKGHLAVPVSLETNDITVDLTQSDEYKYGASLLKGLDECQDFGDYQANLMDIGKQLWEVSDTIWDSAVLPLCVLLICTFNLDTSRGIESRSARTSCCCCWWRR